MKIYISGKITGLPFREVEDKFHSAQNFLEEFGFEVVSPLKNGLSQSHTWQQRLVYEALPSRTLIKRTQL
jgi:nucleoside 2-deoxyribosyltransferase